MVLAIRFCLLDRFELIPADPWLVRGRCEVRLGLSFSYEPKRRWCYFCSILSGVIDDCSVGTCTVDSWFTCSFV